MVDYLGITLSLILIGKAMTPPRTPIVVVLLLSSPGVLYVGSEPKTVAKAGVAWKWPGNVSRELALPGSGAALPSPNPIKD